MRTTQHYLEWPDDASCAFDVVDGQFIVVTADAADVEAYRPLSAMLKRVRRAFGMEFAFIAHWAGGQPVVHRAGTVTDDGQQAFDILQATYGERLLDGEPLRAARTGEEVHFEAVPVVVGGLEYGTLCSRRVVGASAAGDAVQPRALRAVARLISAWFEDADLSLSGLMPLRGESFFGGLPV